MGPFGGAFSAQMSMRNYRAAVYASNGTGKTTISRAFRLAELEGAVRKSDSLITRGSSGGAFSFETADPDGRPLKLEISLHLGSAPTVANDTGYLFHVFNSDYMAENLASTSFRPPGNIDGYIVGKHEIDLDAEKRRLAELKEKGVELKSEIEQAINAAKEELRGYGVSANMADYKSFTYEALIDSALHPDDYETVLARLQALSEIPEGASSPAPLSPRYARIDFDELAHFLSTSFSKADLAAEFLDNVRKKLSFVEMGMSLQGGNECPFCGQPYNDSAHKLIDDYDRYLHDQEKAVIDRIEAFENDVRGLASGRPAVVSAYLQDEKTFERYKKGFSDLDSDRFDELTSSETVDTCVSGILEALALKRADVTKSIDCEHVSNLKAIIDNDKKSIERANMGMSLLGDKLASTSKERTSLRKKLCGSARNRCRIDCDTLVREVLEARTSYRDLQSSIAEKEASGKRSKRDAVAGLFKELMAQVFGGKYTFDPENFSIRLGTDELGDDAEMILSDGEKALVAFCFYVASTYALLEKDDDADKLFFVIDDPISSMDYHHVYEIAQIIRGLGDRFGSGGSSRLRFLLLTHNVAFFNLLAGTKIAPDLFLLDENGMTPCGKRVIAPYSEHLADLKRVGDGESPTHTTGNSIRQVLESLMQFEEPMTAKLFDYLNEPAQADLKKVEYIYTLCNDQSHGAPVYGQEQPIDPKDIQRACRAVVEHIESRYPGQLKALT